MATFLKDVLYPGTYSVPDGKGGRRKVHYDRAAVRLLGQRMKDMLAAGLQIPLAAEHQDKAKPLTDEERKAEWVKKLTLGWTEEAELSPEGFLMAKVAVPVEEEAKRLPAMRFVSPEIVENFTDGSGRLWSGPSITHLAVTPRPVQHKQQPFVPVQLSCVRLSLGDYAGENMADDADKTSGDTDAKKKDDGGGGFDLEALRALLSDDGYGVPDHIKEDRPFLEHLHTAALSKKAMVDKVLNDNDDDDEPSPEPAPDNGPITMSLAGHRLQVQRQSKKGAAKTPASNGKPAFPALPATRLSLAELRADRLEKSLLGERRRDVQARILRLFETGRVTKPIHDKLVKDAGAVRLSLDDNGQLANNAVLDKVEAYEELPAHSAWPLDGNVLPAGVRLADDDRSWQGDVSQEQVSKTIDEFFGMLPGAKPAK